MSSLLGTIDVLHTRYSRAIQDPEYRFFNGGYGDMDSYKDLVRDIEEQWATDGLRSFLNAKPMTLSWTRYSHHAVGRSTRGGGCCCSSGRGSGSGTIGMESAHAEYDTEEVWLDEAVWESPLKDALPVGSQTAKMLFVRRAPDSRFPKTTSILLFMPATGDEEYESRLATLALPLLEHGIASALIVPPLYGSRRAPGQKGHYAITVAEYMTQSFALVVEGVQVLRHMALGFTVRDGEHFSIDTCFLGVAGFSWGGAMAACSAVMSRLPVACIPYVGMGSPACLCTGIMRWQINWSVLMESKRQTMEEATTDIEQLFKTLSLTRLLKSAPKPKATIASLVQIAATDDHFVSKEDGQNLFNDLETAVMDGSPSQLDWIGGGHATAFLWLKSTFVPACVSAVNALSDKMLGG